MNVNTDTVRMSTIRQGATDETVSLDKVLCTAVIDVAQAVAPSAWI